MKEIVNEGNIFDSNVDVICHQVNPITMGSGIAKQVRDRFPRVYEKYKNVCDKGLLKLGMCQVVETEKGSNKYIANLCGQENFGYDGKRYTNYEGIYTALEKLANYCKEHNIKSVAFPWNMSCDRGGANWNIIIVMIESVFYDNEDIIVEYWKYNG